MIAARAAYFGVSSLFCIRSRCSISQVCSSRRLPLADCFVRAPSARDRLGAPDLLLQLDHAEHQRFGGWRAARHVDVHGHDAIATADDGIRIMIVAAAVRAGS